MQVMQVNQTVLPPVMRKRGEREADTDAPRSYILSTCLHLADAVKVNPCYLKEVLAGSLHAEASLLEQRVECPREKLLRGEHRVAPRAGYRHPEASPLSHGDRRDDLVLLRGVRPAARHGEHRDALGQETSDLPEGTAPHQHAVRLCKKKDFVCFLRKRANNKTARKEGTRSWPTNYNTYLQYVASIPKGLCCCVESLTARFRYAG